ncbi:XRE family transcriptional regulator [Candidatus Kirkpatrickella diaphorinae]|uniref:XRE family transcriptional regulator n=1 Tax=Candidatus Kirkpatrickella diaphorinae TaxID=2984322 RepID=A0ABY6GLD3_9PROT|nr:XRE family transcriptional regulator [Candidatus Kirkpatrickella diaphorinae]UYH51831.1 XRE family transcriptional regulator [Candidatus Kirkpatrickella diaphorinae]
MFCRKRLTLARERRGLTGRQLSELSGINAVTISRLESGPTESPSSDTLARLAQTLNYPEAFFFKEAPEQLQTDIVSFRSMKKMNAAQRNAALWAGSLGLEIYDWLEQEYYLPKPSLPDLRLIGDAETAASHLRQEWALGDRPIGNVLRLLESKGVRILSLEEKNKSIDAFSFWRNERPFIFLNTFKTPERSIFDCGHELGHLVLHKHGDLPKSGRSKSNNGSESEEIDADRFASAFLMPEHDVKAVIPRNFINARRIIDAKKRWKVSAMALTRRLHRLKMLSDWQYRTLCIDLSRSGYRTSEAEGIERETSVVWDKVLKDMWSRKMTKEDLARHLNMPHDEVEKLVFGLVGKIAAPEKSKRHLTVV